jgi:hypothetical protein
MALKNTKQDNSYISILADGTLRQSVPEFTEGAVRRDYETSDGKTGTKFELVFTEVSGMITEIKFHEGEFGKSINLTIEDGEDKPVVLQVQTASNFGEDLMKKLPAIDMAQPVRLVPYSFTDEKDKSKKGITVYQNDNKIGNFFQEGTGKESKMLHGYPEIPAGHGKKPVSKDEWKMYFMQCRIFLISYIEANMGATSTETKKDENWEVDVSFDPVTGAKKKADF